MAKYVRNGKAVYARFDKNYSVMYSTANTHSAKTEYMLIPVEDEGNIGWRLSYEGFLPCELGNEKPTLNDGEEILYVMMRTKTSYIKTYSKISAGDPIPEDVKVPRQLSKYAIVSYLMARGVWEDVKAKIMDMGMYDLFTSAQVFEERNPDFMEVIAPLKEELKWTDDQVRDMVDSCIAE